MTALPPASSETWLTYARPHLCSRGVAVVDCGVTGCAAAAGLAAELGVPLWGSPAGPCASRCCIHLDHLADLPLALAKLCKCAASGPVLLRQGLSGKAYRILGVSEARTPPILDLTVARGIYRVPMACVAPADLDEAGRDELLRLAREALAALPAGSGPADIEIVSGAEGPVLSGLEPSIALDAATARVLGLLETHGAAAVCWIPSRSGEIIDISDIDEARSMPHVHEVVVNARPGDMLGHIEDVLARDRIGWVIACADAPHAALAAAQAACGRIAVVTNPMLDD